MKKNERIEKLGKIMDELKSIVPSYFPEFPLHKMTFMAMGFVNSLITLENSDEADQHKMGILCDDEIIIKCKKCLDLGVYFIQGIAEEPVKIECGHNETTDKILKIINKDDQ